MSRHKRKYNSLEKSAIIAIGVLILLSFLAKIWPLILIAAIIALGVYICVKVYKKNIEKPSQSLESSECDQWDENDERKERVTNFDQNKHKGDEGEVFVRNVLNKCVNKGIHNVYYDNFYLKDGRGHTSQIDHLEIRQNGIFVIETKNWNGYILGKTSDESWTVSLNKYTKEKVVNPLKQNATHCRRVQSIIGDKYKVNSIVVLVQNNKRSVTSSNVVNISDLENYIESIESDKQLSFLEMNNICKKIDKASKLVTREEHEKNIISK